jgi:hypothetical protein
MKTLTEIAVRLRIISTRLLSILGFISLGVLIGFWLGFRSSAGGRTLGTGNATSSSSPVPDQKWCDAPIACPYIPADRCGGGTSCERAFLMMGKYPPDWNAFCANMTKQLQ